MAANLPRRAAPIGRQPSNPSRADLSSPPRRGDAGAKPSGGRTTGRLLPGSADGSPKRWAAAVGLGTAGSHAVRCPCRDGQCPSLAVEVFGHLQALSSGHKTVPCVVPAGPGRCQTRPPRHLGKRERSALSRCAFGCCCAQGTPGARVFGVLTGACAGLLRACARSRAAGEPISRYTFLQAPSLGQQPEIRGVSSSFPWLWCHARGPCAGAEPPSLFCLAATSPKRW